MNTSPLVFNGLLLVWVDPRVAASAAVAILKMSIDFVGDRAAAAAARLEKIQLPNHNVDFASGGGWRLCMCHGLQVPSGCVAQNVLGKEIFA